MQVILWPANVLDLRLKVDIYDANPPYFPDTYLHNVPLFKSYHE